VIDETQPEVESDLRRRAAWLLAMLAVAAVLVVIVMTVLIGGGDKKHNGGATAPLDSAIENSPSTHQPPSTGPSTASSPSSPSNASSPSSRSSPPSGQKSCPTSKICALDGDVGNGIAAINAYRTSHGQPAVTGSVSQKAQTCALHNGNGCSGGWAETELSKPDGTKAVQKILRFGKLLDSHLKTVDVGWAYDPGAKEYYFAIIRND
jgi:hypothetical protein